MRLSRTKDAMYGMRDKAGPRASFDSMLLGTIAFPALITGVDGVIRSVNRAFSVLTGHEEASVEGTEIARLLTGELSRASLHTLFTDDDTVMEAESGLLQRNGAVRPVSVAAGLARDREGRPLFITVVMKDLSSFKSGEASLEEANRELKERVAYLEDFRKGVFEMLKDIVRSERELEAALKELRETQERLVQSSKLSALGEFSAGVVHELNQPLTVIKGISHGVLSRLSPGGPEHGKIKLIVEAAARMERVISHLLVFSRGGEPEYEVFDLNAVIKDALLLTRDHLSKNSIEVMTVLKDIPRLYGSPGRIEQVVLNLIANARDAMREGGLIEITTAGFEERGKGSVRMTVRDTGCGIPGGAVERIFDPFFTTKRPGKGTGLGLSISYGIIKEHKGEITVESSPGKGTSFHVVLPALNGVGRGEGGKGLKGRAGCGILGNGYL